MARKIKEFLSRYRKYVLVILVLAGVLIWQVWPSGSDGPKPQQVSLTRATELVTSHRAKEVTFFDGQTKLRVTTADGTEYEARYVAGSEEGLVKTVQDNKVPITVEPLPPRSVLGWVSYLFFPVFLFACLLWMLFGGGVRSMTRQLIGSADFRVDRPKERFGDVLGADEAVGFAQTLVDYLRDPASFGKRQPARGLLLTGPPGTGKTLLARAIAGEAGVPFYSLSGSNLGSMWAGGTTEKTTKFFERLRKELTRGDGKGIAFIDEIDGIASARTGLAMADRDSNSAVTAFLHQVSSLLADFPYAVLVAASNRAEVLDPALIRPGRLGKHIAMPNPDEKGCLAILAHNSKGLLLQEGLDLADVATLVHGLSGAQLEAIPREADMIAFRRGGAEAVVTLADMQRAGMEVVFGTLRDSAAVSLEDQRTAAKHESGHAVVAHRSKHHRLMAVTIIPTEGTGGSTWSSLIGGEIPNLDTVRWQLAVIMGGHEAELLDVRRELSAGSAHDIKVATELALRAVCLMGLYEGFTVSISTEDWQSHPRATEIDAKVRELLDEARKLARETLSGSEELRQRLEDELFTRRILYGDDIAGIVSVVEAA